VKSIGITGPPGAGKTTLWRAVSGTEAKGEIAAVAVPDPRLDALARMEESRRIVPVHVDLVDVHAAARSTPAAIGRLREMDAVLIVVPAFLPDDPGGLLRSALDDLVLADMAPVETRLERARKDLASRREVPVLEAALAHLGVGRLLSEREWERDERAVLSPLAPITLKPLLVAWNVGEEGGDSPPETALPSVAISAALEAEVAGLDTGEASSLLAAYGIEQRAADRMIAMVYGSLHLITFFTASDREARAWEIPRGWTAPEAAGSVHSDMQRGFIRVEVIDFERVAAAGSWQAAKSAGLIRVEGKDYVMADGDVVFFRFAV
jgi:hypothetical protein